MTTHTQRRGHWKQQPCGPGNTERKLIFVPSYWTKTKK